MASITINSCTVTIPTEKRDNIYTNRAQVTYSSSASWTAGSLSQDESEPELGAGTHYWSHYSYSSLTYEWLFSPSNMASTLQSGSITVSGLSTGSYFTVTGYLTVTGIETITTYSRTDSWVKTGSHQIWVRPPGTNGPEDPGELGEEDEYGWQSTYGTSTTSNNTITATDSASDSGYTRPGTFTEYNFTTDTIIESPNGLTAAKVGRWCVHCNKFAHWYNQNGNDTTTANCQATTGNPITAVWYNACVAAIADSNARPGQVTGGPTGSIISASVINTLGIAISKGDT